MQTLPWWFGQYWSGCGGYWWCWIHSWHSQDPKWPYLSFWWADSDESWVHYKVSGDSKLPFLIQNRSEMDSGIWHPHNLQHLFAPERCAACMSRGGQSRYVTVRLSSGTLPSQLFQWWAPTPPAGWTARLHMWAVREAAPTQHTACSPAPLNPMQQHNDTSTLEAYVILIHYNILIWCEYKYTFIVMQMILNSIYR